MKRIRLSGIMFLTLCIFILTGCQASSARADVNGSWLGRDIEDCYTAWGITPGENALKIGGEMEEYILFTEPVDYLGKKFFVRITYPVGDNEFYYNKLDSIMYFQDFYKAADEAVAEKAAELFAVLQKEYDMPDRVSIIQKTDTPDGTMLTNSSDADVTSLQKDGIVQEMKNVEKTERQLSISCDWNLPEEYKKLDSGYVNEMEKYNKFKSTYSVHGKLEYVEGRYIFSISHTFSRIENTV